MQAKCVFFLVLTAFLCYVNAQSGTTTTTTTSTIATTTTESAASTPSTTKLPWWLAILTTTARTTTAEESTTTSITPTTIAPNTATASAGSGSTTTTTKATTSTTQATTTTTKATTTTTKASTIATTTPKTTTTTKATTTTTTKAAPTTAASSDLIDFPYWEEPCLCDIFSVSCLCCQSIKVPPLNFEKKVCLEYELGISLFTVTIDLKISMDDKLIVEFSVDPKKPPTWCIPLPEQLPIAMCLKLYNIKLVGYTGVQICSTFFANYETKQIFEHLFPCVLLSFNGVDFIQ